MDKVLYEFLSEKISEMIDLTNREHPLPNPTSEYYYSSLSGFLAGTVDILRSDLKSLKLVLDLEMEREKEDE